MSVERISVRDCNCFHLRKAARRVTQSYDAVLAPSGIRSTQYMVLAVLGERGPLSVNELAAVMVMNRTTMGKNLRPLELQGLIVLRVSETDRRSKAANLTDKGIRVLADAHRLWQVAHASFEDRYGSQFSAELRGMLGAVVRT
jgi:DNA-binding MarR family transcriptional regulator